MWLDFLIGLRFIMTLDCVSRDHQLGVRAEQFMSFQPM